MSQLDRGPVIPGGFPAGMRVAVTSGAYGGTVGEVVDRSPDLRPETVWVRFDGADTRLIPGYRLAPE